MLEAIALAAAAEARGPLAVSLGAQGESLVASLVSAAAEGAPAAAVPRFGDTLALLLRLPGWSEPQVLALYLICIYICIYIYLYLSISISI